MVLLFNGMQSSLSMVYDREMGMMRLLLTAPLPRWYLLLCKLAAGTLLSVLQAYAFLLVCAAFQVDLPWRGWLTALPGRPPRRASCWGRSGCSSPSTSASSRTSPGR